MAAAMARLQEASNRNAVALNDARKKTAADLREIQRLSVEGARSRVAAEVGLKETSTRRVIHRIITPGLVSVSASYDVASFGHLLTGRVIHRIVTPGLVSESASYII